MIQHCSLNGQSKQKSLLQGYFSCFFCRLLDLLVAEECIFHDTALQFKWPIQAKITPPGLFFVFFLQAAGSTHLYLLFSCLFLKGFLRELLRLLAPDFYMLCLCTDEDLELLFAHRWLVLCFKREFIFAEVLKIWEACWSRYQTDYFQIFVSICMFCFLAYYTQPSVSIIWNFYEKCSRQNVLIGVIVFWTRLSRLC